MIKTIISALIWYTSILYMIWTTVKLVILISSPVWITYLIRRYKRIDRAKKAALFDNTTTDTEDKVEDLIPPEPEETDVKSVKDKYKL